MKTSYLTPLFLLAFLSNCYAECISSFPVHMRLKVLSCSSAKQYIASKNDMSRYTKLQLSEFDISSNYVTIAEVEAMSYVDIIHWNSKGGNETYSGKITPVIEHKKRQMMLIMAPERCETFYKGEPQIFAVDENFKCCHDTKFTDFVETTAQCMTKLANASPLGKDINQLVPIGIKQPKAH